MRCTIIYDLETSGFKCMPTFSTYHKVVQICALCLETNEMFTSFVNPGFKGGIPSYSTHIHNITQADIDGAPTMDVVMKRMYKFFNFPSYETVEMIAHNNTYFDELMIYKTTNNIPNNIVFWDTLLWARENFVDDRGFKLPSYRLEDLYKRFFNKPMENAHRADADVEALRDIYVRFIGPKRVDGDHLQVDPDNECLTRIRMIGEWRASLMYTSEAIETVSQLRAFANRFILIGEPTGFDRWLQSEINVRDIAGRMFIISAAFAVPIWGDKIRTLLDLRNMDEDCIDPVDYYVKYRYVLAVKAPNSALYHRGLTKMCLKKDF